MKTPLIVIAGPTASGKTSLSVELCGRIGGEIISADSMQIYRGMDIGTAKPTFEERRGIVHHMMDIADPSENFSAADYVRLARGVISDISRRGKMPVMVGGTGLYIDSLVNNVDFSAEDTNPTLRRELSEQAEREGYGAMHKILAQIDPETAAKYHPNNIRRIIRAIEFYKTTGETISANARKEKISPYDCVYFCIDWDRETLYDRINRRVDIMLADGLESEAKKFYEKFRGMDLTASQGIGYKEFFDYFEGKCTLAETAELIKQRSRRYAKRQLTWFRRNKDIYWLTPGGGILDEALSVINGRFNTDF